MKNILKTIKNWATNTIYTEQKSYNGSAKETDKAESNSDKIIEQFPIKDTPFTIVKHGEWWFLTLGKYRLTNQLNTRKEAEAEVHDASWIRMMQIIKIVIMEHEEEKQLNETIERQKKDKENPLKGHFGTK